MYHVKNKHAIRLRKVKLHQTSPANVAYRNKAVN